MSLAALFLLTASLVRAGEIPAAVRPDFEELSSEARKHISRIENEMSATLTGRRLLAETGGVPRKSSITGLAQSAAVKYLRKPMVMLAFDPARFDRNGENEFELAFARELARASMDIAVELPEVEMAACQTELSFALDKADNDAAFSKLLRAQIKTARAQMEKFSHLTPSDALYLPPTPDDELARVGYYLALFDRSPGQFYWVVERDWSRASEAVRLTDLEDFSDRFGPRFEGVEDLPGTPWIRMSGRRYPAKLLSAARRLVESGGLPRLREALGGFEGGAADELRRRIKKRIPGSS